MTFHIGSQHANQINNVAGDMHLSGGQHGYVGDPEVGRQISRHLRRSVERAGLDGRSAVAARAEVDEIDAGLAAGRPDRSRIAGALERLTRLLSATGALAAAGAALVEPLQALAGWLGELGAPVLQLLV
jgi:hypothetical protein